MILSVFEGEEIKDTVVRDLVMLLGSEVDDSKRLHSFEYYAWKLRNNFGNSIVVVAREEITLSPIGCITFTAKPYSRDKNTRLYELGDVIVNPEARGAMLFVKMLRIGLDRLKKNDDFFVYGTPNEEGWPHEKRLGFKLVNNELKYYGLPFTLISIELLSRIISRIFVYLKNMVIINKIKRSFILPKGVNNIFIFTSIYFDKLFQLLFYPFWMLVLLPFVISAKIISKIRIVDFDKFENIISEPSDRHSFILKDISYLNWRYSHSPDSYLRRALYNKDGLVAIYILKEVQFSNRSIIYLVDVIKFQSKNDSKFGLMYLLFSLPIYRYFSFVVMRSAASKINCVLSPFFLQLRSIKFIVYSKINVDYDLFRDFHAGDGDNI